MGDVKRGFYGAGASAEKRIKQEPRMFEKYLSPIRSHGHVIFDITFPSSTVCDRSPFREKSGCMNAPDVTMHSFLDSS